MCFFSNLNNVNLSTTKNNVVTLERHVHKAMYGDTEEKSFVNLNMFVRPRLNKLARTVYVNTQFLFCNTTSLILLIRQRGSNDTLTLNPKDRKPFRYPLLPYQSSLVLLKIIY